MDTSLLTGLFPICSALSVAARREVTHCFGRASRNWRWFRGLQVSGPHILRQTGRGGRGCTIFIIINSPLGYVSSPCKPRLTTNGFCFTQTIVTWMLCPRGTAVYLPVTFSISLCPGRQKLHARHGLPETSLLLFDKHRYFLLFKRAGIRHQRPAGAGHSLTKGRPRAPSH